MTLVRTVTPMPDESLVGLVARAAGINVYPHAHDIMVLAGFGHLRPESLPIKSIETAHALAAVMGTSAEQLVPLFHPAYNSREIEFYGTRLRAKHRATKERRVSPRALQQAGYIRAIWNVRPLSFDPHTKETLIDRCPVCTNMLGFTQTWGVEFCEHCIGEDQDGLPRSRVDLRDFPQPLVEVEDEEALDFVTSLIDPNPLMRAQSGRSLNDGLTGLNRGQLFEMAVAIGAAQMLNQHPGRDINGTSQNRGGIQEIEPEALSKAGRALLNWPNSFFDLCRDQQGSMDRRSKKWGIHKELGSLGNLRRDPHLDTECKKAFIEGIDEFFRSSMIQTIPRRAAQRNSAFVGAKELRKQFKVHYDVILKLAEHPDVYSVKREDAERSPLLLFRWQGEAILRRYKDLKTESAMASQIGIPVETIRDFVNDGWMHKGTGIEATLPASELSYHAPDLDVIFEKYRSVTARSKKKPGYITFGEAMLMFPAGRRPWFAMWEAIFYGKVDSFFHKEPVKGLVDAISVRASDIDKGALTHRMSTLPVPDVERVTIGNAKLMLGIYVYPVFTACVAAGFLSVDDDKMVRCDQVMDFASKFMLTNEIGIRGGRPRMQIRNWLAVNGVQPAHDLEVKGGLLYDRGKVEALLT